MTVEKSVSSLGACIGGSARQPFLKAFGEQGHSEYRTLTAVWLAADKSSSRREMSSARSFCEAPPAQSRTGLDSPQSNRPSCRSQSYPSRFLDTFGTQHLSSARR